MSEAVNELRDEERREFYEWAQTGIDRKWISDIVCVTHEGLPNTEEETTEWEEGFDPCIPGVRVWLA
jgi:hypothetical protein